MKDVALASISRRFSGVGIDRDDADHENDGKSMPCCSKRVALPLSSIVRSVGLESFSSRWRTTSLKELTRSNKNFSTDKASILGGLVVLDRDRNGISKGTCGMALIFSLLATVLVADGPGMLLVGSVLAGKEELIVFRVSVVALSIAISSTPSEGGTSDRKNSGNVLASESSGVEADWFEMG